MNRYSKMLSKQEAVLTLEIINSSLYCNHEMEFYGLIDRLKRLVRYDFAICGMRNLTSTGEEASFEIINFNYPCTWLELYLLWRLDKTDPIVKENFAHYKLQYWADTYRKYGLKMPSALAAGGAAFHDGYTIGFRHARGFKGSIFSFSADHLPRSSRTEVILETITPHFHEVLARIIDDADNPETPLLSPREIEVLNWVKYGKSSWDISRILGISERTVNFHCQRIMQKLGAVSRSHAVAIALHKGIIAFD